MAEEQMPLPASSQEKQEARRWELYKAHLQQAWGSIDSSTDSFDQALLAVSSGALGLSLAFIKDIVPLQQAEWLSLLYTSWLALTACIVLTIISFRLSVSANRAQVELLQSFYYPTNPESDEGKSAHKKLARLSRLLSIVTWAAAIAFFGGLGCTVAFTMQNVERNVSKKVGDIKGGKAPQALTPVPGAELPKPSGITTDGRAPQALTNPPDERGRPPVPLTNVPGKPANPPESPTPKPSPQKANGGS